MKPYRDLWSASEAARHLGVRLSTLYAYVSRGLLSSAPGRTGRERLYDRLDVEALRARRDARAGHAAAAAGAMRFGAAILESAITDIDEDLGPLYRGMRFDEIAHRGLEWTAEHLWRMHLPSEDWDFGREGVPTWQPTSSRLEPKALRRLLPADTSPIEVLGFVCGLLGVRDPRRSDGSPARELARARRLIRRLTAALALPHSPTLVAPALAAESVAHSLGMVLAERGELSDADVAALDYTLVCCADHELNASTFAARVAAGAGANLYACLQAALATFSGPEHGAASERVELALDEIPSVDRASSWVRSRVRRGEKIPGFGHTLYPAGDPRARFILRELARVPRNDARLEIALALSEAVAKQGREPPNLDFALVALRSALGLRRGAAQSVFVIGRSAGWVAHVMEQRDAGYLLRPRARYVGPRAFNREAPSRE